MQLTSAAFHAGAEIPSYFTSDGDDVSPELSWKDAPQETKSLALIVHDPDAPRTGGFTHWVVYNIAPETGQLEENVPDEETIAGVGNSGQE
jgi:Raf kinase inhibitor-like YbhB/YbcL family protein